MKARGSPLPARPSRRTVHVGPREVPVSLAIFGPEFTFTGELIAGRITIGAPSLEEIVEAASATPTG